MACAASLCHNPPRKIVGLAFMVVCLDNDQFDKSARGSDAKRLKIFKESTPKEPVVNVLWTTTSGSAALHQVIIAV